MQKINIKVARSRFEEHQIQAKSRTEIQRKSVRRDLNSEIKRKTNQKQSEVLFKDNASSFGGLRGNTQYEKFIRLVSYKEKRTEMCRFFISD